MRTDNHLLEFEALANFGDHESSQATCWTLIREAMDGDRNAREEFARIYQPVVRVFLSQRWKAVPSGLDLEDAVQDVFLDCLRPNGALQRLETGHSAGFRGFLFGVVRNVARRHEERWRLSRQREPKLPDVDFDSDETGVDTALDRAWARALMIEAAHLMSDTAKRQDADEAQREGNSKPPRGDSCGNELGLPVDHHRNGRAQRRVELLRLRFQDGIPIREIAHLWRMNAAVVHHEYATAREEFRQALRQVVAFQNPQSTYAEIEATCRSLLSALQ